MHLEYFPEANVDSGIAGKTAKSMNICDQHKPC